MHTERSFSIDNYEGYKIHAVPHQLADTGGWSVKIHIFRDLRNEMRVGKFYASNSFKTWDEAVAHCFNFGRQVIDGKIENCTVEGL